MLLIIQRLPAVGPLVAFLTVVLEDLTLKKAQLGSKTKDFFSFFCLSNSGFFHVFKSEL